MAGNYLDQLSLRDRWAVYAEARQLWESAVGDGEDWGCPYWGIAACFWHWGGSCMGTCSHRDKWVAKAIEARQRQDAETGLARKGESAVP